MGGYVLNFTVYTLAMTGLICFALFIYKKVMSGGFHASGSKQLSIEETMSINPRKSLIIVRAGNERFLIASDVDKTTLISKLEAGENIQNFEHVVNDVELPIEEEKAVKKSIINELFPRVKKTEKEKQPIHLEVITDKSPIGSSLRKNSYTSRNYKKGKTVSLDVDRVKNHGLSTIKEMAAKINEI